MEEDQRVQKLKAGKEKLAQFQKKKKKKKRSSHQDAAPPMLEVQVGESMDVSSMLGMSAGATPTYDSDQQSQSTCSEDETSTEESSSSKSYLQVKARLLEKAQRVEELEESLAGKQLALDKVIRENDNLRKQAADVTSRQAEDSIPATNGVRQQEVTSETGSQSSQPQEKAGIQLENQSSQPQEKAGTQPAGLTMTEEAGGRQFDMADVQELLHHVQWLQVHLRQANRTMQMQNEKQKTTVAALHCAREEIFILKDNIDCKDQLLSQLADKLTKVSTQHDVLKKAHQEVLTDTSQKQGDAVNMEKELGRIKEMLQKQYEDKLENMKKDSDEKVKSVTEKFEDQVKRITDEMKVTIDQLEAEKVQLQSSKDDFEQKLENLTAETEAVKTSSESLMKDMQKMQIENKDTLAKLNDALSEKDNLQSELVVITDNRDDVMAKLSVVTESLEEMKSENCSLLNENQDLIDEISKFKEDNSMYRKQLTEREDELRENGEVMEENLSLRMQNDELYNKINNQKDLIASLKGELELLTCENFQLVGKLKDHTIDEEKYKKEIENLMQEKESISKVVDDMKSQLDTVIAKNVEHKETIVSLESQINVFKQKLIAEDPTGHVKSDSYVNGEEEADVIAVSDNNTDKMTTIPVQEQLLVPNKNLPSAAAISAENMQKQYQENVSKLDSTDPLPIIEAQLVPSSQEQLECEVQHTSTTPVCSENFDNGNSNVSFMPDQKSENGNLVSDDSAKHNLYDANAKIQTLQQEVLRLTGELDRLQNTSTVSDSAGLLLTTSSQTDYSDMNSDITSEEASPIHTIGKTGEDGVTNLPESVHPSEHMGTVINSEALKMQLQMLQSEYENVSVSLHQKVNECEKLKEELQELKQDDSGDEDVVQQISNPENTPKDSADSSIQLPVPQEVSDIVIPSLQTSELEVNLHASSGPSQHGTFSQDITGVVGNIASVKETVVDTGDTGALSRLSELEDPEHRHTDKLNSHDVGAADDHSDSETALEHTEKLRKDQDNHNRINVNLQQEIESLNNTVERSNEKCEMLRSENENLQLEIQSLSKTVEKSNESCELFSHENEKLQWERDELALTNQSLAGELNETKTLICDKEFREEEIKDDYNSVKERLEYLESSAEDCFEMREMLDKIQEEKEAILKENESLQCSLSAKLSEAEQLMKRLETSTNENRILLQEREEINSECSMLEDKVKLLAHQRDDFETKLSEISETSNETECRLSLEIEGLLEENSTLKTRTQSLQTEVESLQDENTRLNSFFPNIDKESEQSEALKLQVNEFECKLAEMTKENENLVEELMEHEGKFNDSVEENRSALEKCEQLQQIIEEMDDEKTELLNSIELSEESTKEQMKELAVIIEKLEMQLSGLDEENSTLKTQVLGLSQDVIDMKEVKRLQDENISKLEIMNEDLKSENAELNETAVSLEQEFLSLVEQTKNYEQIVSKKSDLTACLENDLKKILDEKCSMEEKCSNLEQENNKLKNSESYLKQQLRIYEGNGSDSQETERLYARIELEVRYKTKLQQDIENYQQILDDLEKDNTKLNDDLTASLKEISNLKTTKLEDETLIGDLSKELETARNEKDDIVVEMKRIDSEYQAVTDKNAKLTQEVELLQGHLQAVSDNRNHIRNQTEVLVAELDTLSVCRDSLTSYVNRMKQQNRDVVIENHELKQEVDRLLREIREAENQSLGLQTQSGAQSEVTAESSEKPDVKSDIQQQYTRLKKTVDDLNVQLGMSEKEKQALENLTEDLTNMLRDMQTKYEEVKSEMENTKRSCDKEIGQLQTQLHVMNDDVQQLRKMLDFMENEVYHAAEEKTVLKENLEQQQAQYVEAVEQKQLLEEILGEKHEKDRKNLEMANRSNRVQATDSPETVQRANDANVRCQAEAILSVESNVLTSEAMQSSPETQMVSQFLNEHLEVPSFEHALNFMGFQDDVKFVNSSVQTDVSGTQCDCMQAGMVVSSESNKCFSTSSTQTEVLKSAISQETPKWKEGVEETDSTCFQDDLLGESNHNDPPLTSSRLEDCDTENMPAELCVLTEDGILQSSETEAEPSEIKESDKELSHDSERDIDCSVVEEHAGLSYDSGVVASISRHETGVSSCNIETQTYDLDENTVAEQEKISEEERRKLEEQIEGKLLEKFSFREKLIKSQEDNYEKKVKQIEYDIEEEFEFKFRKREAEVMVDADTDRKNHAREVEEAAEVRIEKIKKEKDQQFVETLQKVRDDLARRHGGHASKPRGSNKPGPDGDASASNSSQGPGGDNSMRQLKKDNEDLASARDALLHKIDVSQQEQTAFQENLFSIMGDEDLMSPTPNLFSQKMPAWLDWDIVPDISFDSVSSRTTLDTKSLSGSLDPSSFCSNSDCLSVRMKYEQLIDKIQQYLKINPNLQEGEGEGTFDEVIDSVNDELDGAEAIKDRFVESNEPDSQVLQRITSMHLEHFVREPSELTGEMPDQFVHEPENSGEEEDANEGILQAILKESDKVSNREEKSFDKDDIDVTEDLKEEDSDGHFVPFDHEKDRGLDDSGTKKTSTAKMKRHFSESDTSRPCKSEECDQSEGHFVLEKSPSVPDLDKETESYAEDDVFKAPSSADQAKSSAKSKSSHKKKRKRNANTPKSLAVSSKSFPGDRSNRETTPGSEAMLFPSVSVRKPLTGEESGDFFGEEIVRNVHRSLHSAPIDKPSFFSDSIVLQQHDQNSSDEERVESGDILESIRKEIETHDIPSVTVTEESGIVVDDLETKEFSEELKSSVEKPDLGCDVNAPGQAAGVDPAHTSQNSSTGLPKVQQTFSSGKQSYENAVFDILNSICPGTDPSRIRGEFRPTENQFQAVAEELSDAKPETGLQELQNQIKKLQTELSEMAKEKNQLEKDLTDKTSSICEQSKAREENHDLLKEIEVLQKENSESRTHHQAEIDILESAKVDTENALLSHAEMFDKLLEEKKAADEQASKLRSELETEFCAMKSENEQLSQKIDEDAQLQAAFVSQDKSMNEEMSSLKQINIDLTERVKHLSKAVDSHSSQLKDKEMEFNSLKKERQPLLDKLHQMETEVNELHSATEELTQKLTSLTEENQLLKASSCTQDAYLKDKQNEVDVAVQDKLASQTELNKLLQEKEQLTEVVSQLKQNISGLHTEKDNGQGDGPDEKCHINETLEELSVKVVCMKQENAELKTLVEECKNIKAEKDTLEKCMSELRERNEESEWAIKELGTQIETYELEKQNLQAENTTSLQESQTRLDNLQKEIYSKEEQIQKLQDENKCLNQSVQESTDGIQKAKKENEDLLSSIERNRAILVEKEALQNDLLELSRQNEENILAIEKYTKHIENLEHQIKNQQEENKRELDGAVYEKLAAQTALKEKQNELDGEIHNKLAAKTELEEKQNELDGATHDKLAAQTAMKETQNELDVATHDKLAAEMTLKEKQNELDNAIRDTFASETELNRLLQERSQLNEAVAQLKQKITGSHKEKDDGHIGDVEMKCHIIETVEDLSEKVMCIEQENSELKNQVEEFITLKIDRDALEQCVSDMKERNEENEWAIKELGTQIESFELEKKNLQTENTKAVQEMMTQLDTLKKEVHSQGKQNQKLQDENKCLNNSLQEVTDDIKNLKKENEDLMCSPERNREIQTEKETIESDLREARREIEENRIAIENYTKQIENLEREMKIMQKENMGEVSKVEADEDKCSTETEKLQMELAALKSKLTSLEVNSDTENDCQILQELREELNSLQEEKSAIGKESHQKCEKLEKENISLSHEVESLQEEIDSVKKKAKLQEDTLKKENTDVLKMYSDLRNEVEILVISKHDLEVELHALKDLLEQDSDSENTTSTEYASRDTSRELTVQDLEEMEALKNSIEKLKSDLKEKDDYVRKLEEHLLNINKGLPTFSTSPKPAPSSGNSALSKRMKRKRSFLLGHGRRAYSHDQADELTEKYWPGGVHGPCPSTSASKKNTSPEVTSSEQSLLSENQFVEGIREEPDFKSSVNSVSSTSSSVSRSFEVSEVNPELAKENGHVALERKQFELVDEITTLRRDFRETKALYAQEAVLLTEALEKEKLKKDLLEAGREQSRHGYTAADILKLKQEVAVLKEENKMLKIESDNWLSRLKEQEQIVLELRHRLSRNTSGIDEIEEVFGRQLALLQKQREELVDKLKERELENCRLSTTLGEKGVIEETLRREKEILLAKLQETEDAGKELTEFKMHFEKQVIKRKQMEEVVTQKDQNEIQLMKQKRVLEEELHEIESKFRDREETLESEKHKLLDEIKATRSVRINTVISENDDETMLTSVDGAVSMDRNIDKLEEMLNEVEKQHSSAVKILRDQLKGHYNRKEQALKEEQAEGLKKLKDDTDKQVT